MPPPLATNFLVTRPTPSRPRPAPGAMIRIRPGRRNLWLAPLLALGLAVFAAAPGSADTADSPRVVLQSSIRIPVLRAGEHPGGIIFSAKAHPEPDGFSWEINGRPILGLPPELGRFQGSPRQGIVVYTPPATLSGPSLGLSIVAIARIGGREVRSAPFALVVHPRNADPNAHPPSAISMIRTREENIPPSCKTILANLNAELAAYAALLERERENQVRNEDVIAVLSRIRNLSDQAKNCTGLNLGLLDKLQLNLVNRLAILIKDKAKNLWERYDALTERLRDAPAGKIPSILRQIFGLQIEIKGMYEEYKMEMSESIVERLDRDAEMIREALNESASEPAHPSPARNQP